MNAQDARNLARRFLELPAQKRRIFLQALAREQVDFAQFAIPAGVQAAERGMPSYAQQRMWFLWQLDPQGAAYNLPGAVGLDGPLDRDALAQALEALAERHETLRSALRQEGEHGLRQVAAAQAVTVDFEDLSALDAAAREQAVQERAQAQAQCPFDLEQGPLWRVRLLKLGAERHVLLLTLHHIVSDGWSMNVLIDEFIRCYDAFSQGQPMPLAALPIQYADYALWQRAWLEAGEQERQLAYWQQVLGDEHPVLELPTDHPRPATPSHRGTRFNFAVDAELALQLRALAQQQQASLFMVLLAAFDALLYRYSGQAELRVGVPIANRNRAEVEGLIGFFVNTQVLNCRIDEHLTVAGLIAQVRDTALGAQAHQELPFERLVEALKLERSLALNPLFQVMYNHQPLVTDLSALQTASGIRFDLIEWKGRTTQFDLSLDTWEKGGQLYAALTYADELFDAPTIARMAGHWLNLLRAMVADTNQAVARLPMLGADEQQQLLHAWNPPGDGFDQVSRIDQSIARQAAEQPEALALTFGLEQYSYGQLDRWANRLAQRLVAAGVGPETRVGVALPRTPQLLVSLLAVFKAGGAYVPLDPDYPAERVAYMLEDSAAHLVLSDPEVAQRLALADCAEVLLVDADEQSLAAWPGVPPANHAVAQNLAYVIYTSGSTGRPKGVAITHRNVMALLHWSRQVYGREDIQGVLASTSICFDLSVWELFVTLAAGGSIVLARNALELPQLPARDQVRLVNTVPSAITALLRDGQLPAGVRIVNLAGEPLKQRVVDELYRQPGLAHVYDLYGPSEDTTYSTWTRRQAGGRASIGRPLPHTAAYLLDAALQPVPQGCAAELYLAGAGITRGYLGRPGLTAERFVPDPFAADGGRLYRTGDLLRYRDQGELEYIGRIDHQVKVRGFRIELGEIEARLQAQAQVSEVAVLAPEGPSGRQLVAYVVPANAALLDDPAAQGRLREQLRAALGEHLPDYMVPAAMPMLAALPLTPNGKLDRKALPAPDALQAQREHVAPGDAREQALAQIWQALLGLEQVGVLDNFFELGGDSIVSMQVVSRAREAGLALTPKDIFQHQTIRGLAQVAGQASQAVVRGPASGEVPLTPIQHWFFDQAIPSRQHWNQALLLDARAPLQGEALAQAVQQLVEHHDSLRLRFEQHGGTWQQRYGESAGEVFQRCTAADAEAALALCEAAQRSLDLADGPLLRVLLIELPEGRQQLLLVLHHLVVDGVSWRVLLEDLEQAYRQVLAGQPPRLPARTSAYQDWALRLQQALPGYQAQLPWWREHLGRAAVAELPCDNRDGALHNRHEHKIECRFDAELTRQLLQVAPAAYRTQVNDLLLTALARVLCRWTAAPGALIELEGHGREDLFSDLDLSRSVGWFTSLQPVLLVPEAELGASLVAVKEQLRGVPDKGIGHGLLRYLGDAATRAELAALPRPRVTFNYLGQFDRQFDEQALLVPASHGAGQGQDPDAPLANWLTVEGQVYGGELALQWGFSQQMFAAERIQALVDAFAEELRALVAHCVQAPGQVTASDFPLAGLDGAALAQLPVAARQLEDLYPLSPMQQGMLFHSLYEQAGSDYINQMRVDVEGLHPARLRDAWQQALDAHAILRTGFAWQGEQGKPLQMVMRQVELPWRELDWRDRADLPQALAALAQEDREHGFDLAQAPLLRLTLVRTGEARHHLIQTCHHLLLDGWSNSRLLGEVLQRYAGQQVAPPVGLYRDYIQWLGQQDMAASEAFWRDQLASLETPTRLAHALPTPPQAVAQASHGDFYQTIDAALGERLGAFARQQKVTVNTLVQAAWLLLLQRCTGQDCVAFGATVAGRPAQLPGIEAQIGLFINTLPVIARPALQQTLGDWLQQVQALNLALREHEHTPLFEIQRWSGQGSDALFDTLLVFENYPLSAALAESGQAGVRFGEVANLERTNYPLTLAVTLGERLQVHYSYLCAALDAGTVQALAAQLECLLGQFVDGAGQVLATLDSVPPAARQALLAMPAALPAQAAPVWLHQLIEAQARRTPEAIALVAEGRALSYASLDSQASDLAQRLVAEGVGPEVLVGISLPRGERLIIGLLAILKAGGAYVPLDPEYPAERLGYMLADSGVQLVLGDARSAALLAGSAARLLRVDELVLATQGVESPSPTLAGNNLLCLLYTSGSTGRPKGVALEQGALLRHLLTMQRFYRIDSSDRFLHFASLNFDWGTEQWLLPLISGARCVLRGEGLWSAEEALEVIEREQASLVYFPTQYACQLAAWAEAHGRAASVRSFNVAGEAFPREGFEQIQGQLRPQHIVNGYGPTETVITPFLWEADATTRFTSAYAPIGRPVAGRSAYLLAEGLALQADGVVGELYIGGEALARGYHAQPSLTAERFVPDPFASTPGARLYRSGDLVRRLPDGQMEYIGRVDHQVKIRGFRVETGEVEACLLAQAAVAEAAVVAVPGPVGQQLVAYVVPRQALADADREAQAALCEGLRAALGEALPDYMQPAHWQVMAQLPLTPNGKLDRKALPAPDASLLAQAFEAPRSALQGELAALWGELLGVERVGLRDNFFDLGGHSLLATQVISRVRHARGVELPLRSLFEARDLEAFAATVDACVAAPAVLAVPQLQALDPAQRQPLSFAQQRLWFLWQLEPHSSMYNIPRALQLDGELDIDAVRTAFEGLLQRHSVLRTTYAQEGGDSWQQVHAHMALPLAVVDLRQAPAATREVAIAQALAEQAQAPFDLVNGPVLRVAVLRLAEQQHLLLVTLHHIVADHWSFGILLREFVALYDAAVRRAPASLPAPGLAYLDFAVWQRQWLAAGQMQRQLDYWQRTLGDDHRLSRLPGSPQAGVSAGTCQVHAFDFPPALAEALRATAKARGLTLYMLLLAGFSLVVAQRCDSRRVRLGTDVANRNHAGVEEMVGFFVNQLVLQLTLDDSLSGEQWLERCRDVVVGASDHQDLPFDRLVEALRLPRQAGRSPLFAIKFIYQEGSLPMQAPHGLQVTPQEAGQGATELDLIAEFVNAERLTAAFKCDASLYTAADMQGLFVQLQGVFERLLEAPEAPLAQLLAHAAQLQASAEQAAAEARQAQLKAQHPIRRRARGVELQ
ncbi:non-ribosomal peptide synthetase [Pseudomonas oryziphila]|uniref:Amino acid adenylation domain-containing protein n=1 Tax=Pseudomonas oryziphila TaxID=2894079 RepID=A0ABM7CQ46_9PSED|nr:non-ribosomal peptide synthetase [Pseudomonas oryziphila]AZL73558.1 amino acid adenylation domain-containing protein [Pseudomonas oryziphila]